MKEYYAHTRKDENGMIIEKQTVSKHCKEVGKLCGESLKDFGLFNTGLLVGYLHDLGKTSEDFQKRLFENGEKVDHSTAGGIFVSSYIPDNNLGRLIRNIVVAPAFGHHSGLGDTNEVNERLRKENVVFDFQYFNQYICSDIGELMKKSQDEIVKFLKQKGNDNGASLELCVFVLIKLIYSALVNADHLDTMNFTTNNLYKTKSKTVNQKKIHELKDMFDLKIKKFRNKDEKKLSDINIARSFFLNEAIKMGDENDTDKFRSLILKTGAGKTYTSMAYALHKACSTNRERIIIVMPFLSIIEQNAKEYKNMLGEENVLENHSNFNDENYYDSVEQYKKDCELWNSPIVVTTAVQFLESIFSNKPSRSKKFINMANSVVVIDEAQMLPIKYLKITQEVFKAMANLMNIEFVFSTATAPLLPEIKNIKPIIPDVNKYDYCFERCDSEWIGEIERDELIKRISKEERALCIVNTKKKAREICEKLKDMADSGEIGVSSERIYHLSANLLPEDRSRIIEEINRITKQTEENIILVSTQLIEAGVDISFPVGFREIAGIDSIVQSAGRINRNKEISMGKIFIFAEPQNNLPGELGESVSVGSLVIKKQVEQCADKNLISDKLVSEYFYALSHRNSLSHDRKNLINYLNINKDIFNLKIKTLSNEYKIIEDSDTIIVDDIYGSVSESIDNRTFTKTELQKRSINISPGQLKKMLSLGIVEEKNDFWVLKSGYYDDVYGISETVTLGDYCE